MKIKLEHYEHLKSALKSRMDLMTKVEIAGYWNMIRVAVRVKDPGKRSRWDLLYAANLDIFICETLYKYLDDTHIDTALRSICKEIGWEAPR